MSVVCQNEKREEEKEKRIIKRTATEERTCVGRRERSHETWTTGKGHGWSRLTAAQAATPIRTTDAAEMYWKGWTRTHEIISKRFTNHEMKRTWPPKISLNPGPPGPKPFRAAKSFTSALKTWPWVSCWAMTCWCSGSGASLTSSTCASSSTAARDSGGEVLGGERGSFPLSALRRTLAASGTEDELEDVEGSTEEGDVDRRVCDREDEGYIELELVGLDMGLGKPSFSPLFRRRPWECFPLLAGVWGTIAIPGTRASSSSSLELEAKAT